MASDPITVLHLSDVQFGRHHRFASDESFDTLYQRLEDDLERFAKDDGLRPDLVVVAGDLAEWGRPSEFADALHFLERTTKDIRTRSGAFVSSPRVIGLASGSSDNTVRL